MTARLDFRRMTPHLYPQQPAAPSEKYRRTLAKIDSSVPYPSPRGDPVTKIRNAVVLLARKEISPELDYLRSHWESDQTISPQVIEEEVRRAEAVILDRIIPQVMAKIFRTPGGVYAARFRSRGLTPKHA